MGEIVKKAVKNVVRMSELSFDDGVTNCYHFYDSAVQLHYCLNNREELIALEIRMERINAKINGRQAFLVPVLYIMFDRDSIVGLLKTSIYFENANKSLVWEGYFARFDPRDLSLVDRNELCFDEQCIFKVKSDSEFLILYKDKFVKLFEVLKSLKRGEAVNEQ